MRKKYYAITLERCHILMEYSIDLKLFRIKEKWIGFPTATKLGQLDIGQESYM